MRGGDGLDTEDTQVLVWPTGAGVAGYTMAATVSWAEEGGTEKLSNDVGTVGLDFDEGGTVGTEVVIVSLGVERTVRLTSGVASNLLLM